MDTPEPRAEYVSVPVRLYQAMARCYYGGGPRDGGSFSEPPVGSDLIEDEIEDDDTPTDFEVSAPVPVIRGRGVRDPESRNRARDGSLED
jgi:hypothetical protein